MGVNWLGMVRPPTLTRPHKGGRDAPACTPPCALSSGSGTYSTVTCVFTELAMKQISWAW